MYKRKMKVALIVLISIGIVVAVEDYRCTKGDNNFHYCTSCGNSGCQIGKCVNGFVDLSGECKQVATSTANCGTYSSNNQCLMCKKGFYLNSSFMCEANPLTISYCARYSSQ